MPTYLAPLKEMKLDKVVEILDKMVRILREFKDVMVSK